MPFASSPAPITAFVAGATGYTGREVVRALRNHGVLTVAHVRPDSTRLEEWRARFGDLGAEIDTTPWDEAAMTEMLAYRHPKLVFALLGTTQARARRATERGEDPSVQNYEAIDYGLSALLLRAAVAAGHRPRFVYLSSMGVSDEARGAYLKVRARLERELKDSGLPYTIARPSFITGSDRDESRPFERLGAGVGDALLGVAAALGAKRLRDRYASIDPKTLSESLVKLALSAEGENKIIEADGLRA